MQKHILAVNDITCAGKCALTIALPIISAAGIETSILPTALLSTHTAFKDNTFLDLSNQIIPICNHFKEIDLEFDCIYIGYLGSKKIVNIMEDVVKSFKKKNTLLIIDPIMGDNGTLYKGIDSDFPNEIVKLCKFTDVIIPNITEAVFMLKKEYKEMYTIKEIENILIELSILGPNKIILTGVTLEEGYVGVVAYDKLKNEFYNHFDKKINGHYHGTGDVFSSVIVSALLNEKTLKETIILANDYVINSIKDTLSLNRNPKYGLVFENYLMEFIKNIC